MPEICLGDYTGYIFTELVRAREMADAYSRTLAQRYADDPVLRFFSVPRYKVPKMELTVPVLISAARFSQLARFDWPAEEFVAAIGSRADDVRASVALSRQQLVSRLPEQFVERGSGAVEEVARKLWEELAANPDPLHPQGIVKSLWPEAFRQTLAESELLDFYEKDDPSQSLLRSTTDQVVDLALSRTVVDRTEIDDLLVDPETNVVTTGSDPHSVFTIRAELQEEAFFLRSIRDDDSGAVTPVVEFD